MRIDVASPAMRSRCEAEMSLVPWMMRFMRRAFASIRDGVWQWLELQGLSLQGAEVHRLRVVAADLHHGQQVAAAAGSRRRIGNHAAGLPVLGSSAEQLLA